MKNFFVTVGNLKPALRWGVLALLLFIIAAGYYFAIIIPHKTDMAEMKNRYNLKRAELNGMAAIVTEKGYYLEEIENLNREFKVASSMLPDKKEIPSLLKKISEEAEKFGLDVYYFEPMSEVVKGFYAEVPVSIKLKGGFHEVLSFFDSVNKLARIVNVRDIVMKALEDSKEKEKPHSQVTKGNSDAFSAFQLNKTNLDVSFKATTFRFLGLNEMNTGENANQDKGGKRGKQR